LIPPLSVVSNLRTIDGKAYQTYLYTRKGINKSKKGIKIPGSLSPWEPFHRTLPFANVIVLAFKDQIIQIFLTFLLRIINKVEPPFLLD